MNTLCLVVSRMSIIGALFSMGALAMTGSVVFLCLLILLAGLAVVFDAAYNNYRRDLREMHIDDVADALADAIETGDTSPIDGLAELLEPDE